MTFRLGRKSLRELEGVHQDMQMVVHRAIQITKQDFTVFDGIRTPAEQRRNIENGVSWTMKSMHLPCHRCGSGDVVGLAVDLVPWIDGRPQWKQSACLKIGKAVRQAAWELGIPVVWGAKKPHGHWNRNDAAHFELNRNYYPATW